MLNVSEDLPVGATKVNPGGVHVGVDIVADFIPIFLLKYNNLFVCGESSTVWLGGSKHKLH
jgi:hypothetical protein